ncbi:FkbM family methyltransferase [Rhizobium leguminosarum]|uniref:FkbM family methyltransferase n=1 Tax=Rhizobium leguminosarum TaxID=384 RepID=UPI000DE3092F|nr:FkbM family methyltransferase [Rhizobium leguminosarum]MDI5924037.1 FkbM family methyltransferase [Rhizobium leguminosarum]QIO72724.1 FkbM family methyltransferase [Rhizobium leguminosarum bv. trifolii]QIO79743.1 FkbM family methyltransferase [Rhizobium leguminosarum bv. trifolii]TAY36081.1 FkbM family methyltransferase [Rhizobium leguminosarum]WSH72807.1 FkbM family methyltransferase [Rhizobium leguminosarum]
MTTYIYMLEWHKTSSPAFHRIFVNYLRGSTDVVEVVWDGKSIRDEWRNIDAESAFIFCQKRPPDHHFKKYPHARVIWIPMWNNVMQMSHMQWARLPKHYKIISYSPSITAPARRAGLRVLEVQYVPDVPADGEISWSDGNILYYWNRVGLVKPDVLAKICKELDVKTLYFKPRLDPGVPEDRGYQVSDIPVDIPVVEVPFFDDPAEADQFVRRANIVIAPRPVEGVGLSFLEAMARGCTVLSVKQPTMTDYIEDGVNGIFLETVTDDAAGGTPMTALLVSPDQDWERLRSLNMQQLGNAAHAGMSRSHAIWIGDQERLNDFVFDPINIGMDEGILGELHRLIPEAQTSARFDAFYARKLRNLREQIHPTGVLDRRIVKASDGAKYYVNMGDRMGCDFYYGVMTEVQDLRAFIGAIRPTDVILDIGANIGLYTVASGLALGGKGKVYSFEPDARSLKLLSENIQLNSLSDKVRVFDYCIGSHNGTTSFSLSSEPSLSGMSDTGRARQFGEVTLPIHTVDWVVAENGLTSVDAIKIDVEGHEPEVLEGAMETIEKFQPLIMLELTHKNLPRSKHDEMFLLLARLFKSGYTCRHLSAKQDEFLKLPNAKAIFRGLLNGNYFFIKEGSPKLKKFDAQIESARLNYFPFKEPPVFRLLERLRNRRNAQQIFRTYALELINTLSKRG